MCGVGVQKVDISGASKQPTVETGYARPGNTVLYCITVLIVMSRRNDSSLGFVAEE